MAENDDAEDDGEGKRKGLFRECSKTSLTAVRATTKMTTGKTMVRN